MLDMLKVIEPNTIDSIITDPPYGLTSITKRFGKEDSVPAQYGKDGSFSRLSKGFMGKEWDGSGIEYNIDAWEKCYEVLKPGGYLLAFGGSRTFHRIACAIEGAGFEIRDTIMWLYGSGFPKSVDISRQIDKKCDNDYSKQWQGWGTALKPSFEPIIVARKPFKGSLVDNIIENGVGGINIDECRIGNEEIKWKPRGKSVSYTKTTYTDRTGEVNIGRFPANTILTYDETDFNEVCGCFPYTNSGKMKLNSEVKRKGITNDMPVFNNKNCGIDVNKSTGLCSFGDSGSASRYFYCAKASRKDRNEGLEESELKTDCDRNEGCYSANVPFNRSSIPKKNIHPTVKPTELMQYLIRLVTPNNGTILDPFNGSGSTGKAVMYENKERNKNYKYVGIELTEEYLPISKARIEYVCNLIDDEEKKDKQLTIFDLESEV